MVNVMQQSIVRRTIGPPGMVRHLFNVRRVSMYHDGPQCPNYDGHSSTTTELSVSFVTYHYSILTNHYCPSDGRFIGKYAYACTHCTCILLQKQVQPCWILKLHFLIRGRGWLAPVADLHSRSWSDIRVFSLSERNFRKATDREGANKSKLAVYILWTQNLHYLFCAFYLTFLSIF